MKWVLGIIFVLNYNYVTAGWQSLKNTRTIEPKKGKGFDFSTTATEITWKVSCSSSCNVYLLDLDNLNKLSEGASFTTFYEKVGTTSSTSSYSNAAIIKKRVIIYVLNPSDSAVTAYFIQEQLVPDSSRSITLEVAILASLAAGVFIFCTISACIIVGVIGKIYWDKNSFDRRVKRNRSSVFVDYGEAKEDSITYSNFSVPKQDISKPKYTEKLSTTKSTPYREQKKTWNPTIFHGDAGNGGYSGYSGGDGGDSGDFGDGGNEY